MGFITLLKGFSQALEAEVVFQKKIQLLEGGMVLVGPGDLQRSFPIPTIL